MTNEERIKYLDESILVCTHTNDIAKKIVNILDSFNGKVLNRRFETLLKEKVSRHISVRIHFDIESVEIRYWGVRSLDDCSYNHNDRFFILRGKALAKTESGKYRLDSNEAKKLIQNQIRSVEEKIKVYENGKGQIAEIRKEMKDVSDALKNIKNKYDSSILSVAGCDYELKNCTPYEFADCAFSVY